jgi:two-component system response regulator PilR (NtrC family)
MRAQILIVDDEPEILETLQALFREEWRVASARTAAEAIAVLDRDAPPVMIVDLGLPDRSGIAVLEHSQTIASPVRAIVLTAESDIETAARTLGIGAAEFVTKPFDSATLKERVIRFMPAGYGEGAKR